MKNILRKISTLLLPLAALAFASCTDTTDIHGQATTVVSRQNGVPGGKTQTTFKAAATVTAIDHATRTLSLRYENGATTSYTAGADVVNFKQIKVGDVVRITVVEEVAVSVREKGVGSHSYAESGEVGRAKKGDKPGMYVARTQEVTAKVYAIDPATREVTFKLSDGTRVTTTVGSHVNLAGMKEGDTVITRLTQYISIQVGKP